MGNAERLMGVLAPVFGSLDAVVDDALLDRFAAAIEPIVTDDFVCAMIAFEVAQEFKGAEGARAGLADWTEAYTEFRLRVDDVHEVGDNVLMDATQLGVTRHGGVEVEQPSAAVWKFRGDRLARVEFHLDRAAAKRSAE